MIKEVNQEEKNAGGMHASEIFGKDSRKEVS